MSIILLAALSVTTAVTGPTLPNCSWDRPGVNPFMGDVVAAVDRYRDIPASVRTTLKQRMAARKYDEIATIRRDSIEGAQGTYSNLRDMHFGKGTVCEQVTRERWHASTQERGLVYCEQGHCIIVPTVCRNVSRINRDPIKAKQAVAPASGDSSLIPDGATDSVPPAFGGTYDLAESAPKNLFRVPGGSFDEGSLAGQAPTPAHSSGSMDPISFVFDGAGGSTADLEPLPGDWNDGAYSRYNFHQQWPAFASGMTALPAPDSSTSSISVNSQGGSAASAMDEEAISRLANSQHTSGQVLMTPEPSIYVMMCAGLLLIILMARRRRVMAH